MNTIHDMLALNRRLAKCFPSVRIAEATDGSYELQAREDLDSAGWVSLDRRWKGLPPMEQVLAACKQERLDPYAVTQSL